MIFRIFKISNRERYADLDGDDGYYTDIEVPDGDVHNDVAEMIYDDYFRTGAELTNATQLKKLTVERITKFMDDCEAWDKAIKLYFDELRENYEDAYNHE